MNRIEELKQQAGIQDNPDQEGLDLFANKLIEDLYMLCDQAWAHNEKEKTKEGVSNVEQLIFAGAMAQCQKMKENIAEFFGVKQDE